MCEIKSFQILDKKPELINSLDRYRIHPLIQKSAYVSPILQFNET